MTPNERKDMHKYMTDMGFVMQQYARRYTYRQERDEELNVTLIPGAKAAIFSSSRSVPTFGVSGQIFYTTTETLKVKIAKLRLRFDKSRPHRTTNKQAK